MDWLLDSIFIDKTTGLTAIEAGDVLVVLQYVDGEWVAIDPELVEVVDGKVIVKLANSGTLAFVTVAE